MIGGAAAVLKYGASAPTKDIDTWNRVPKAVQDAADAVGAMGQGVPLAPAGVAEIPNDAELRFKTVSIGIKKLVVRVPDRYDLALSKTIRGYDNDLQVIKEMHEEKPFSLKRLVALFETEMDGAVTKDKRALRLNVAVLVPAHGTTGAAPALRRVVARPDGHSIGSDSPPPSAPAV